MAGYCMNLPTRAAVSKNHIAIAMSVLPHATAAWAMAVPMTAAVLRLA